MFIEDRNPFFDVKKEDLVTVSGIPTGKKAVINSETNDILGIISKNYEIVKNYDVYVFFESTLRNFGANIVKSIDHLDSKTRKWKRWLILDGKNFHFNIGDNVDKNYIMVEIFNGYNAKTSFGYNVMGFRSFCENGLIIGKKNLFSDSFAHFIDNPEKLFESFKLKFNNFKNIALIWDNWTKESFDKNKWILFINKYKKDPENNEKHRFLPQKIAEKMIYNYEDVLSQQRVTPTKWGAFNVLTYYATHETKARKGSNIFSNSYKNLVRLTNEFYNEN